MADAFAPSYFHHDRSKSSVIVSSSSRIGDDQLHPAQAAGLQRAEERGPECPKLGVADIEPEHLTAPVSGHAAGDHDRLGTTRPFTRALQKVASRSTYGYVAL